MPTTEDRLRQRWQALRDNFMLYEPDCQDIIDLLLPSAPDISTKRLPGQSRTSRMFDTTGPTALRKLTSNLMGAVSNPALDWHQLKLGQEELQDDQEVQAWLYHVNKHLLAVYNRSNFYSAMNQFYLNYAAFGTAVLLTFNSSQTGDGYAPGLLYTVPAHGTYVIAENADGEVDTFMRLVLWTPLQAIELFGAEQVSKKTRELAGNPQMQDVPQQYLHAIYPRSMYVPGSMNSKNFRYADIYMELETQHICRESGHRECPVACARWEKLGETVWGFGPGHMALPDLRTMNKLKELQLQMLALWVQPPLKQVHEGVLSAISLQSLAVNVVRRPDDLTPLEITGRPDLVQISQQDLRASLYDIFYVTGMEAIPPPDAKDMTAYEVAQRIGIMQRLMGPAFHHLTSGVLNKVVDRTFALQTRKRLLPVPPIQLLEAAARRGGQIDIEYDGPLARAQKSGDVQATAQLIGIGMQMQQATGRADVWDVLLLDDTLRHVAEVSGFPMHLIRDQLQVQRIREAQAMGAQHQQQQVDSTVMAQNLGQVAPFISAINETRQAA